ncbi:ejaculatory bulb-specific protein 3-like [Aricia agestis]|uniref:ejaculatory bulb-specific protein 3-like n=1 Tax=Aricia agestis TaxID=91739 RepID=UPI001C203BE4|nr:ejaculatory bulb-specific protein 3-like [Aricia agestis]
MLKQIILLCCLCGALAQKYHTLNDDYDEDAAVKRPGLLKKQFECFLDKGPCTPVWDSYKKYISEAVERSCDKCLPNQEHEFKKFLAEGKRSMPDMYDAFRARYDPTGQYWPRLEVELQKY